MPSPPAIARKAARHARVTAQAVSCPRISGVKLLPSMTPSTATITLRRRNGTAILRPQAEAIVVATMAPIIQASGRSPWSNSQPPAAPTAPDKDADYALMQQALKAAVEALPERRRAVFELCFLQELTYREAAEALSISVKTVENQMGHALKAIRTAMARYVEDG